MKARKWLILAALLFVFAWIITNYKYVEGWEVTAFPFGEEAGIMHYSTFEIHSFFDGFIECINHTLRTPEKDWHTSKFECRVTFIDHWDALRAEIEEDK